MHYLKFNNFGAYIHYLKEHGGRSTHLDVGDLSTGENFAFAIVATCRLEDCILVCHELAHHGSIHPPEDVDEAKVAAWNERTQKKIQQKVWQILDQREKAFRADGVDVRRGILTANPPEVLARAK